MKDGNLTAVSIAIIVRASSCCDTESIVVVNVAPLSTFKISQTVVQQ